MFFNAFNFDVILFLFKGLQWTENSCYRQVIFRPEKRGMFWLARSQWGWKIYYIQGNRLIRTIILTVYFVLELIC
jgi:hypothetical protein